MNTVKEVLHTILNEELMGKSYDAKNVVHWSVNIADLIKNRVAGTISSVEYSIIT